MHVSLSAHSSSEEDVKRSRQNLKVMPFQKRASLAWTRLQSRLITVAFPWTGILVLKKSPIFFCKCSWNIDTQTANALWSAAEHGDIRTVRTRCCLGYVIMFVLAHFCLKPELHECPPGTSSCYSTRVASAALVRVTG